MSPISSFLRFVKQPTATSSAHGSLQALAQTPHSRYTQILDSVKQLAGECLTAERYLCKGFWGKKESCYSQTLDKQAKPSSSMEYDMPKAIRWLSTLLFSPLSVLAELKLVAKVENQTPLLSTDKACELLK